MKDIQKVLLQLKKLRQFQRELPLSVPKRIELLNNLKVALSENKKALFEAMKVDLNKDADNFNASEYNVVIKEIDFFVENLANMVEEPQKLSNANPYSGKTIIKHSPLGIILILTPFNFPMQLALMPLVGAIAGGNRAILKMSPHTPEIAKKLKTLLLKVIGEDNLIILDVDFDHQLFEQIYQAGIDLVFFTGSQFVGKKIQAQAAQHGIDTIMELGGINPFIILKSANLEIAAKALIRSKIFNKGQVCINPNYVLVPRILFQDLRIALQETWKKQKDANFKENLMKQKAPQHHLKISSEKTIIHEEIPFADDFLFYQSDKEEPFLQQESFTSVLPFILYENEEELKKYLHLIEDPLSIYIFSNDYQDPFITLIVEQTRSGSIVFNQGSDYSSDEDTPFGGIGKSGNRPYTGKYSFRIFTYPRVLFFPQQKDFLKACKSYPYASRSVKTSKV